jgi:hypothetical protein
MENKKFEVWYTLYPGWKPTTIHIFASSEDDALNFVKVNGVGFNSRTGKVFAHLLGPVNEIPIKDKP